MADITVTGLTKTFIVDPVLRDVTFLVNPGEKIAIVGANGSGKTTLLRLIAGRLRPDEGSVKTGHNRSLAFLEQIPVHHPSLTADEVFSSGAAELLELGRRLEELSADLGDHNADEYSTIFERWEQLGGYTLDSRKDRISAGLHISELLEQPFQALSGGEKTRVEMGRILLSNPDILILDEPTNHLDIPAREWLESFIMESSATIVLVSHDRYFLDRTVDRVIEVVRGDGCEEYHGGYSYFLEEKQNRFEQRMRQAELANREVARLEESIARMRLWAGNADNENMFSRVKSMEKRLDRMDKPDAPQKEKEMKSLSFTAAGSTSRDVLRVYGLGLSYSEEPLFSDVSFDIYGGDRIALIGPNGCGKTSLLDIIAGRIRRSSGELHFGKGVAIGLLEQEIDFPRPGLGLLEIFLSRFPMEESRARAQLARFLFFGEDVFREAGSLSGGEKVRFRLCLLFQEDINLLILDEPTNHLDIPAQVVFENAILDFDGTVLFVSHDRWFINSVATRIFHLEAGNFRVFNGDYEYFQSRCTKPDPEKSNDDRSEEITSQSKSDRKLEKRLERQIAKLEQQIDSKEQDLKNVIKQMESAGDNYGKLLALQQDKDNIEQELDMLLADLLELEEGL